MDKKEQRKVLAAIDAKRPLAHGLGYYGIIQPRDDGEFEVTVYAVSKTVRYGARVTAVNRAWSDRPYYRCKDLWKSYTGATIVCFDEKRFRKLLSAMWYNGRWGEKVEWKKDASWMAHNIVYLNLEALKKTKYRYCAFELYDKTCERLSLVPYCQLYAKHPQTETFVYSIFISSTTS